ncbi:MAG TPA: sugar phosphate isomerase/epimerase family protein [Terriglobia bacterium]|jgi:sugar phosphate isomerase/epimerase|nr:sugar phosphate isomerase/epimerase family protein [Terriglobia bacterium]
MDFALSTYLFVKERLNSHILDQILDAGIHQIEIFAARQHLNYCDPDHVRDVAQWFSDHGVAVHSVHGPLFPGLEGSRAGDIPISIAYLEKRLRIASMDEVKRALEIAERLPFRYLVLHLGLDGEEYDLRKFDAAFSSLEHLKIFAKDRGVQVLLENIPNQLGTPQRLLQFVDYTRLDLKICFDTGHAHIMPGVQSAFATLKDRIASTHIHDNAGEKDDHLMPYDGGIDWDKTIRDFRTVDGQFPVLFELSDHGPEKTGLARLREVMEKLERIEPSSH